MNAEPDARMEIFQGDITELTVDALVNAANSALAPGAGVCGAIHRAAGPRLAEACADLGGCPTGEARITPGYDLSARYVIHAVGPVWHGGHRGEPEDLAGCYKNALDLAASHGLRSIAFPAISTGVYGYPLEAAAEVAIRTVRECLSSGTNLERVVFAVFGEQAEVAYRAALGC